MAKRDQIRRVVFATNVLTIILVVAYWVLGILSWSTGATIAVAWLLLPFGAIWSWPDGGSLSWWRACISMSAIGLLAVATGQAVLGRYEPSIGVASYFATTLILSWLAVKARASKFAHAYAFLVALGGAYAVGFAIEILLLQIDGYIPSPQPWPVITWSILGITAFAIAGMTTTAGLVNAIPCWLIAALLVAHGIVQHDQVPTIAGAMLIGLGILVLIFVPRLNATSTTSGDGPVMDREAATKWPHRKLATNSELATEKAAQLEVAELVLKPLTCMAAITAFAMCFWWYDLGPMLSIGAAILTYMLMLFCVALPVGYFLGSRARWRALAVRPPPDQSPPSGNSPFSPVSPSGGGPSSSAQSASRLRNYAPPKSAAAAAPTQPQPIMEWDDIVLDNALKGLQRLAEWRAAKARGENPPALLESSHATTSASPPPKTSSEPATTRPQPENSSPNSGDRLKAAISLGQQMALQGGRRILAMKMQDYLSRHPRSGQTPPSDLSKASEPKEEPLKH